MNGPGVDEAMGPLFDLGRAVAAERDLPTLFEMGLRAAAVLCEAHDAFLFAPGGGSGALQARDSRRRGASSPEVLAAARRLALSGLRAQPPAFVSDGASGVRLAVAPIMAGERPLGCLVAAREGAGAEAFDEPARRRLQAVADLLAAAMQVGEAYAEQQRRGREFSLLNEVAADCAQLGFDDLLPVVTRRVCRAVGRGLAAVVFADEPEGGLVVGAVCTEAGPVPGAPARLPIAPGLAERTLASRQPRRGRVAELGLAGLEELARARGLTHLGVVPLVVKDRAIGLACAATGRPVGDDELRLVEALASEVAVAVENARLFAESQRRAADLELVRDVGRVIAQSLEPSLILREASRKLADALEVDAVRVFLRQGRGYRSAIDFGLPEEAAERTRRLGADDPVIAMGIVSQEPVAASAEQMPEPTRSFLSELGIARIAAAPLRVRADGDSGEQELGVLVMGRRAARGFSPTELRVVAAVASQLAVALQNGQLYERTRKSVEDLSVVTEAGRALVGAAPLGEALDGVADRLASLVGVRAGVVLLVDAHAGVLKVAGRSAQVPAHLRDGLVVPSGHEGSMLSEALRERRPVHRSLTATDEGAAWAREALGWAPVWAFALPLAVGDQPVGAVMLVDDLRRAPLSEADVERARTIGQQVAFAVERARLNARLERSLQELADAQAQLVQSERLAALGELAALVAHEVRNPLGAIVTSLGSLSRLVALEGDARRVYEIIGEEAQRLNRIVGDILDWTRPAKPRLEQARIARVLEEAVQSARAGEAVFGTDLSRVRVEVDAGDGLEAVPMDERLVHQALVNLLSNALQSVARDGGTVRLEARAAERAGRPWARLTVRDDGPGIAPEAAGRLFQPFFTTKARGSGLGLAVVRRIAEGHGGEVRALALPGGGAAFELDLPLPPAPAH